MPNSDGGEESPHESEAATKARSPEIRVVPDSASTNSRMPAASVVEPPASIEQSNSRVLELLARVRDTRAALRNSPFAKLQATQEKFRHVTSATEDAASNIMDSCDRANALVDALDTIDAAEQPDRAAALEIRSRLRDELFQMMSALQFQDITSQQLNHSSAILSEVEARLFEVAQYLDGKGPLGHTSTEATTAPELLTYDPDATMKHAEVRQALVDDIFSDSRASAA